MAERRFQVAPEFMKGREDEHRRKLSQAVKDLQKGRSNNHYDVMVSPNTTETTITVDYADVRSIAQFHPASASAALAVAAGAVWTETKKGEIILHHDSQPATDRRFGVVLIG